MDNVKRSFYFLTVLCFVISGFVFINTNTAMSQEECFLSVTKNAIPAIDTPFTFQATGDDTFEFTVSDPSDPTSSGFISIDNTVTITEVLPEGWELANIECVQGVTNCGVEEFLPCLNIVINEETNSITATCLDDDEGSCTFTNVLPGRAVPTISQWGLIAVAIIIGAVGFMVIRRRAARA